MQKVNSGTAYLLWCLCFFGFCGVHRLYTGNIVSGLIYVLTFGLFGMGQLVDLLLIPGLVERRNLYFRRVMGTATPYVSHPSVTVTIGELSQHPTLPARQGTTVSGGSPMQRLLRAAKAQGGQLSLAQAAMYTELEPDELKQLLHQAEMAGYAEITNDPQTGAIRYRFDL